MLPTARPWLLFPGKHRYICKALWIKSLSIAVNVWDSFVRSFAHTVKEQMLKKAKDASGTHPWAHCLLVYYVSTSVLTIQEQQPCLRCEDLHLRFWNVGGMPV